MALGIGLDPDVFSVTVSMSVIMEVGVGFDFNQSIAIDIVMLFLQIHSLCLICLLHYHDTWGCEMAKVVVIFDNIRVIGAAPYGDKDSPAVK